MPENSITLSVALKKYANNLNKVIEYLDRINRFSFTTFLRAFLWDTRTFTDQTNYRKARIHLMQAFEILRIIQDTRDLINELNTKLNDPHWADIWNWMVSFPYRKSFDLLEAFAGSKDIASHLREFPEKNERLTIK